MTTLHSINKAPSNSELWQSCLAAMLPGDALICIEAAAYAILDTELLERFAAEHGDCPLYFLQADLQARGLSQIMIEHTSSGDPSSCKFKLADDADFVELACQHSKVVSWF